MNEDTIEELEKEMDGLIMDCTMWEDDIEEVKSMIMSAEERIEEIEKELEKRKGTSVQ
jgi:peptidoglycan hydrolase CwlO-like protein